MINDTPRRSKFIPFNKYSYDENEKNAVLQVLESDWITTGPKTKEFEKLFAEYIGCKHAIALNSCTAGLHISLLAYGIGSGDEVLVPDITFTATSNVVIHTGAKPVLTDINPETLNICLKDLEKKITKNTKAIIPVHMAGQPCDMDKIHEIAKKYHLKVIEDAAHATEAWYKNKKIGNISELTAFSFYATKNLSTAEGGMLTTNNDILADKLRVLSLHGLSKDAWKRYSNEGYKHYDVILPGFKYNMTDIQSALGIEQLKKLEDFSKIRNNHKKLYDSYLKDIPQIELIKEEDNIVHARHLYIIKLKLEQLKINRDQFMNLMIEENIGVSAHFIAIHKHSYYKNTFNLKDSDFPNASRISDSVISLPFYPKMTEEEIIYVCNKIKEIIANH